MKSQEKEHNVFGNWTIFDMLSHLAGWAVWRVKATEDLIEKGTTDFSHFTKTHDFNANIVSERVSHTWDHLIHEVKNADEKWIELLGSLSDEEIFISTQYQSPAWDTLSEWVKIAYEHYSHHADLLKNFFEAST